ncbi:Fic family protein [Paraburkholderia phenazinium]|uniref:IclR helix-turn-helix domain-containing protein n=1 Tax=Paraburkholderia phenazinium TaxID=60549 RepID=A0A1G7ZWT2_9BURK|nr:Fic family protein [Paraburkholderia phenazinium]SDH13101.1 IclR helix-turn-helix domain-containing protein [Paraburkholderia phenazinium]
MAKRELYDSILNYLAEQRDAGDHPVSRADIATALGESPSTVLRYLARLKADGKVEQSGSTSASRWGLPAQKVAPKPTEVAQDGLAGVIVPTASPSWSGPSQELFAVLESPLGVRKPVTYQRSFVDAYKPNQTFLLPESLANDLFKEGRMQGQQPAGTYARNVIAPLLIDLSFSSSRLEGNRYTRLDTEVLFRSGNANPQDKDAIMLLNHKRAIEFLIDEVPLYGLTVMVVRNIHTLLMQGLLHDENALGAIRQKIVNISNTVYVPAHMPSLLEEMLGIIVAKARDIKNPVEAAFFLWLNLAYLQPFEDGNKRTSRLAANIPLLMYNCAPLSFLDVTDEDYSRAKIGVYERLDTSVAADLFAWTYRRSIEKYAVQIQAAGLPDLFRAVHRDAINELVSRIVRDRHPLGQAVAEFHLSPQDAERLIETVKGDIARLGEHNFARYRLTLRELTRWVEAGRPLSE